LKGHHSNEIDVGIEKLKRVADMSVSRVVYRLWTIDHGLITSVVGCFALPLNEPFR